MKISKTVGRVTLVLEGKDVGGDLLVTLTGGAAHIGAAALAYRDSETGRTTASVLCAPGHKEEEIALRGSKIISKGLNKTVLFSVGIHLDDITPEEIAEIEKACMEIIENSLNSFTGLNS
ncbi:MAG: hypothetical protein FWE54_01765 [Methanimicrococcus sp.]|nr:hypothetical protein [Methanimicrococcus sp.]